MDSSKINTLKNNKLFSYEGKFPKVHDSVFLAEGVRIVGDVTIGQNASVWYNSVIRGDVHFVTIGEFTNIQDGAVLHVTHDTCPLIIGNYVTVGHGAILHGCIVKDNALVGMGSIILDKAIVEENSFVAAGALVTPGFVVPSGKLVAGSPAKVLRDLRANELADLRESALRYAEYAEKSKKAIGE
mgnify:FL=1